MEGGSLLKLLKSQFSGCTIYPTSMTIVPHGVCQSSTSHSAKNSLILFSPGYDWFKIRVLSITVHIRSLTTSRYSSLLLADSFTTSAIIKHTVTANPLIIDYLLFISGELCTVKESSASTAKLITKIYL